MKLSSTQIVNKSNVTGASITDALNRLITTVGDGSGDMLKAIYDTDNDGIVDQAAVAVTVPYTGVTGKPATFPPSVHNHTVSEVTNLQTTLDGKAASSHSHAISDVTSLQTSLDSKQATLVSGTNIKTINGETLLGSGDIVISGGGGSGDVVGPASSVNNNIAVFDGTTGKLLKDGGAAVSSLATTSQLSTKQDTLVSGTNIKTINGSSILGSGDLTVSGGSGGLTLETVSTTSVTAATGKRYVLTNAAKTTITVPATPADGFHFGVDVCNGRSDNEIAWNGSNHENISDAVMVIADKNLSIECQKVSTSYGFKVRVL